MIRSVLLWPVKVGVIAAALWYFLRDPLPTPADWIVAIVAAILLHLSYAAMMAGIRRTGDLRLLQQSGEPPADGKRIALAGTLKATGNTLRAPMSGKECLGYSYEIAHTESTRSRDGRSSTRRVTDFSGVALAPCVIHTLQGDFRLLSYPYLQGFPEDEFSKDDAGMRRAGEYIRTTTFEKRTRFLGELAALNRAMLETDGSLKKDWRMTDEDGVVENAEEERIPVDAKVCAFGICSAEKRSLVPATASDSRSLLLVAGEAEEVARQLASSKRSSRKIAIVTFVPAVAIVAFILGAPGTWIRAVPGGSLVVEKHSALLREALWQNDLRGIAASLRYLDPNLTFEEAARTPLMLARSAEAAELLVSRGASVRAHDANGYSVLMNAAEIGSPGLLRYLTSHGADVNERLETNPPTTALSLARDRNTPDAVDALIKAGARE